MATLYPIEYAKSLVTMSQMRAQFENHMEPEFARRLFNWIESQGGAIGIGGGRRTVQPDRPGFAPPGMSFHQDQRFADGTVWYSAVDLVHRNGAQVHRAPTVDECPQQNSAEAARWGVHINTSESWHMQAVPQDGYMSWLNAGRPRPNPSYVIPGQGPGPTPPEGDDDEVFIQFARSNGEIFAVYTNGTKIWQPDDGTLTRARDLATLGGKDATVHDYPDLTLFAALGQVTCENAPGHDNWGNKVA